VPPGVQIFETKNPVDEVANMPPSGFYLVMTHSHSTDFDLCQAILTRGDSAYCGLIGSRSKRRQFEKRFRSNGLDQALINQLVCPIGIEGIDGKKPREIAIATAAEILQLYERRHVAATNNH
jgi:xanthine dehydrogenase accessory factor